MDSDSSDGDVEMTGATLAGVPDIDDEPDSDGDMELTDTNPTGVPSTDDELDSEPFRPGFLSLSFEIPRNFH